MQNSEMFKKPIILVAGGTGGHLFPAKATAQELIRRGFKVHIITDKRALKLVQDFADSNIHVVRCGTFKGLNPIAFVKASVALLVGAWQSYRIFKTIRPSVVGGFGGYPTLSPLVIASGLIGKRFGIKTFIHEQNAVMGRANRFLARRVDLIAGGFLAKAGKFADKIVETGNPVRRDIIEASAFLYKSPEVEEKLKILIFGGSQGASFFSQIMPKTMQLLSAPERTQIAIVQQARQDGYNLSAIYKQLGVEAEIAPFFDNLAQKMRDAHYIISRSGASTIAEIASIGRPALLVPYPYAIDHDQAKNAEKLAQIGGARIYKQADLNEHILVNILRELLANPEQLAKQARRAKKVGNIKATKLLAGLVEQLI
ncbi:MAG: undecaprenyldiphospho-muramoylpentapeptide beta-N-acetylglucosaminyltransferase [Alphaproteobacteria bacterium]|nr:undecaprenyldiphospho-muramoylpentapeptide beta-N-acetylglucosaminyltransferase [Alphaproteobacteria bacterium]